MTWTNQETWTSGLLSSFRPSRSQTIKVADHSVEIHVFRYRDANKELQVRNLIPFGVVNFENPSIKLPFRVGNLICIVVDKGFRLLKAHFDFTSSDGISGSIIAIINYRVANANLVLHSHDVLSQLKSQYLQPVVRDITSNYAHDLINPALLESEMAILDTSKLGIKVDSVTIPAGIIWPPKIREQIGQLHQLADQHRLRTVQQDYENTEHVQRLQAIRTKLAQFGITHPALVASALAQHDTDINAVLETLDRFGKAEKDHRDQNLNLLKELISSDLVPRVLLDDFVEKMVSEVTEDRTNFNPAGYLVDPDKFRPAGELPSPPPNDTTPYHNDQNDHNGNDVFRSLGRGQTKDSGSDKQE